MDDKDIRNFFSSFTPEIGSAEDFARRIGHELDAVEIIRKRAREIKRRNRLALALAGFSGMLMGVILVLLKPYLDSLLIRSVVSAEGLTGWFAANSGSLLMILIVAISAAVAFFTYDIATSFSGTRPEYAKWDFRPGSPTSDHF